MGAKIIIILIMPIMPIIMKIGFSKRKIYYCIGSLDEP